MPNLVSLVNGLSVGAVGIGSGIAPSVVKDGVITTSPTQRRLTVARPLIGGTPNQSVKYVNPVAQTFTQTRELSELNFAAAGDEVVIELGDVMHFLDLSATALAVDKIKMITPDGMYADLAAWTILKTSTIKLPGFAGGKFTFVNVSGAAVTGLKIFAVHQDD